MASRVNALEEENKKLKKEIVLLKKEMNKIKARGRTGSARADKGHDYFNKCEFSRNRQGLEESSIEKNNSKESWSKLINTDLDILKELRSPSSRGGRGKGINEKVGVIEIEPKVILQELSTLKEENKYLKLQLSKNNRKTPRSESRISRKMEDTINETNKNNRTKHCKVCVKLLTKGYTTRFCPVHGHSFKSLNKSYLT